MSQRNIQMLMVACHWCGIAFLAKRRSARWCSESCKQMAKRARQTVQSTPVPFVASNAMPSMVSLNRDG